jgi:predicted ATPase
VVEALRGLGRGLEPAALDNLVGPGRPLLALLLPELGRGGEATPAGLAVGSSGQAQLFEAFLAVLERLADRFPTLLVLEDLHWADRSTLDLLAFLHRNLRSGLLLVLTYRTDELHRGHRLRPFLAGLDRSGRADRLELGQHPGGQTGRRPGRADLPPLGGQCVLRRGAARRHPRG